MASRTSTAVDVDGRRIELSNLGKVLFPGDGFTKAALIEYYVALAPVLVPHLRHRPLTLKRYPDGITGASFYEKRCPRHRPPWLHLIDVQTDRRGAISFCSVDDPASLVWVANLAAIELHPLLSRSAHLDEPTMIVFDLDPGPPAGLLDAAGIAMVVRDTVRAAGLHPLVKVSGGKGMHVAAPVPRGTTFDQTKAMAHRLAIDLERRLPDRVVSSMRKDLRGGRVFVDWSQNDAHKTTVAAYSLRARPGPTVSAPVTWDEVEQALSGDDEALLRFGPEEVIARVGRMGDLHEELTAA